MKPRVSSKFLLLDFGYPMETDAVKLIQKSIQNSISLLAAFYCDDSYFDFGIKVINSQFNVVASTTCLLKKYNVISHKIEILNNIPGINEKVTVQDYKHMLKSSFESLLQEYYLNKGNMAKGSMKAKIQIYVLTKKRASLLSDILVDVINKLPEEDKNVGLLNLLERVNVIQIIKSSEEAKIFCTHKRNNLVSWTTCVQNSHKLDCLMKDLLLRPDDGQHQLHISLLKEINLTVRCNIDDCIVRRPDTSILNQFDLHEDTWTKSNTAPADNANPVQHMEILYRLPLSGLCPTLIYGTPRRIRPAREDSCADEPQTNTQIFRALCRELSLTEQGLLTKSKFKLQTHEVSTFYFITSDGHTLLLNSVSPFELHLPQYTETTSNQSYSTDQDANEVIKSCLHQVRFLENYSSSEFRSGIYEYLKSNLMHAAERFSFFGNIDPVFKSRGSFTFDKINNKDKFNTSRKDVNKNNPKTEKRYGKKGPYSNKKKKVNLDSKYKNIHPALLPTDFTVEFRKDNQTSFYSDEITEQ